MYDNILAFDKGSNETVNGSNFFLHLYFSLIRIQNIIILIGLNNSAGNANVENLWKIRLRARRVTRLLIE